MYLKNYENNQRNNITINMLFIVIRLCLFDQISLQVRNIKSINYT